jgi:creatinine amidohydrolase/Fe(II)-dependent formamide hydrolase-like protein
VNCLFKPLVVIDAAKAETIAHFKLAGHPKSFQLEKNGGRIFVNVPDVQHIVVLDRGRGLTRKPDGAGKYRPSGVCGDPTLATKEKGRIIVEATVSKVLRQVRELIALQ